MMDILGYFIGFATGLLSAVAIMWLFTVVSAENEPKDNTNEDLRFPKVWELGYSSQSYFKLWIDKLFYKHILGKGNLADFIRLVPCSTDGFHVGLITITFHLIERPYKKNSTSKLRQIRHSVILKRKDVDAKSVIQEERNYETLPPA